MKVSTQTVCVCVGSCLLRSRLTLEMLTMIPGILVSSVTRQGKYFKGPVGGAMNKGRKAGHAGMKRMGVWSLLGRMLWMRRRVGVNGKGRIKGKWKGDRKLMGDRRIYGE